MAGECEDFVSIQADSLPTGSISFGRFELESLSWEKRSSFSHNRYLEEVEKYSTPGSVTQKKAYFEAHFKKRALEREASSLSHNGIEGQATENDIEDNGNYIEEYADYNNGGRRQYVWNDKMPSVSNKQGHEVMESNGGQLEFSWYDETPPAASDEDEYDIIESHEGEIQFLEYDEAQAVSDQYDVIDCKLVADNSPSEIPLESMLCNDVKVLDYPTELVEQREVLPKQSRFDTTQSDKDDSNVVMEKKTENVSVNVGELSEKCDIPSKNSMSEKDNACILKNTQKGSLVVKAMVEQKSLRSKLSTPVPQIKRKTSTEKSSFSSVKAFTHASRKTESGNSLKPKTERQSSVKVSPSRVSNSKNCKPRDPENLKAQSRQVTKRAQSRQVTKSGKDLGAKKEAVRPQSICTNSETHQSTNRPKKDGNSIKADIRQSNAAFNFKSGERAEKRKQFYMRLEEKINAKEVEINEIQARAQMETEAAIKLFRRSLNFKAAPMPSFYHGSAPRGSDGKKKVGTQAKSLICRSKSANPGGSAAPQGNSLVNESASSTHMDCPTAFEGDSGCSIAANKLEETDKSGEIHKVSRSAPKVGAGKKEEKGKPMVQQHQGESKAKKADRVSIVRRGRVGKVMKGIVGSSVAVHVAS